MYASIQFTILLWVYIIQGSGSSRICANLPNNRTQISIDKDYSAENGQREGETESVEQCKVANSCYTLWKETTNNDNITVTIILAQGCWESSGKEDCGSEVCIATQKQTKALNNTKFCCCSEDQCNQNHTEHPYLAEYDETRVGFTLTISPPVVASLSQQETVVVLVACSLTLVAVLLALLAISRHWRDPQKGLLSDAVHLMEGGHRGNNCHIVDHIKLSAVVGQGRYGTVWMGYLENQQVAIKVFPASYKQYYFNERDIYCLPFMENSSLLTYFGCSEKVLDSSCTEYLLVLSYCSNGCLQDYIRLHTIDFNVFCQMALSIAKGLAFLHTDIDKGDKSKPCVCHRDLNTRNILVNADLTCCLCDLGLAIKLSGSHYYTLGEEQHAETKSISDVGTLRYMAPEVLEGAVNLRDCETSLKQIDVYALGLVLWELASRCSDFYQQNVEVPPYRMPFETEIGQHPTFDQMQVLVTRKKARPLFPDIWQDCPVTRLVRETIDDCWDQDAEARLTALCVEERLVELSTLSFRGTNQMGVSPTINMTQTLIPLPNYNNINESTEDTGDKEGMDSNLSEGTVETLLTLSPSEPCVEAIANSKNSNSCLTQAVQPLQPHQGRNPCFERNLMWDENCQPSLINRSMKHHPHNYTESHSLVNSDYLNYNLRVNNPIPFVQNAVFDNNNIQTIPKQHNVPGNSNSHKQFGGILSKPLKKLLEPKKNRSDLSPKSNVRSQILKETEVSLGDQRTITAILGNDKENTGLVLDSKNNIKTKEKKQVSNMKVIISPFEETSHGFLKRKSVERPSSLPLVNSKNNNTEKKSNLDDIFTDGNKGMLKDLACRIKTPGDVPPSVRRKRGKSVLGETRFSLYDDRMMEGLNPNETEMEANVTTQSFTAGIELSGRQVKLDSSF